MYLRNIHKQFDFKNNIGEGKINDEEKLISFYKQNRIMWENVDPNYRNKVKRQLIKVELVTFFDRNFPEEFLEKYFHSLRTSMIQEMEKPANGYESKWNFIKTFWLDS